MNKIADLFSLLSDETRLRILILLFHRELCVCEICSILGESQPKVSRHLGKLRDLKLVKVDRQSQWIFYRLDDENRILKEIIKVVIENLEQEHTSTKDLLKLEDKNQWCERIE